MKREILLKIIISIILCIVAFSIVKAYAYTETVYSPNYYEDTADGASATVYDQDDNDMPVIVAIMMELFVTIHMTVFVIIPLSHILAGENYKSFAITLSIIRAVFLLLCDFFVTTNVAMLDFFAVFIGAFIVVPLSAIAKGILNTKNSEEHFGLHYTNPNKKSYEEFKKENNPLGKYDKYKDIEQNNIYDEEEEDYSAFDEEDEDDPIKNL